MKRFLITAMLLSISAFSYSQIAVGVKVANPFVAVNVMKHQIANTPKGIRNGGGIFGEFYIGAFNIGAFMRIPLKHIGRYKPKCCSSVKGFGFFIKRKQ